MHSSHRLLAGFVRILLIEVHEVDGCVGLLESYLTSVGPVSKLLDQVLLENLEGILGENVKSGELFNFCRDSGLRYTLQRAEKGTLVEVAQEELMELELADASRHLGNDLGEVILIVQVGS